MGVRLKNDGYKCDLLITSPAVRALNTAKLVAEAIGYKEDILIDERLYMADIEDYFEVIDEVDDQVTHLMIVSHNPGSQEFAEYLTSLSFEKFPTAAYTLVEIEGSWSKLTSARLLRFDFPKSVIV